MWCQAISLSITNILLIGPFQDKLEWNSEQIRKINIQENAFKNVVCERVAIVSPPQCDDTCGIQFGL